MRELRDALTRIRMEYLEMPDLKLTSWQTSRLLNLDPRTCDSALAVLVDAEFLVQARDGSYLRRSVWRAPGVAEPAALPRI